MDGGGQIESSRRGADPLARRSDLLFWLFGWYLRWYFYRSFHAVRVSRAGLPPDSAGRKLIVYGNHPSWWDPAVYILAATLLFPERRGFGPMDEAALGKYGVLERMGVFGVPQGTARGGAVFLHTSLAVLQDRSSMLWITAEGHFTDHRSRPVVLRPGLAHLARRVPDALIVPLAIEYTFWNESRAEVLLRFGTPVPSGPGSVADWNARLSAGLSDTMDALASESMTRDARLFRRLLRGGTGIGGIYDGWRRLRALLGGRPFDPSHEGNS